MSNLVMAIATGYKVVDLEPLIKSLRKYYNGEVVLFMYHADDNMKAFMDENNVTISGVPTDMKNGVEICNYRHKLYKEYLQNRSDVDRVLILDSRDTIFQDDPFKHQLTTEVEFFMESQVYKNDECNGSWWIRGIYGQEVMDKMANEYIVCAGTTMGTKNGMLFYFDEIIKEIDRMKTIRSPQQEQSNPVVDQPCHGYLIYNGSLNRFKRYMTGYGPVATMSFHDNMRFDKKGNLLNEDGSIVAIVHQWDRTGELKSVFYKNAIGN